MSRKTLSLDFIEDDQGSEESTISLSLSSEESTESVDFDSLLGRLLDAGIKPSSVCIDLFLVAIGIYAADTRISRSINAEDGFSRDIELTIPVSSVSTWNAVANSLENLLAFLTGDIWHIRFSTRPDIEKTLESDEVSADCVSLFSGGLDSFVGAIDLLEKGKKVILVSHYSDGHTCQAQKNCLAELIKAFPKSKPTHLPTFLVLPQGLFENQKEETQRSRSFLFLVLACLVQSGTDKGLPIIVPENGVISLNVPLDYLRLGALSTRTTHPFFFAQFNAILDQLGIATKVENPYRFKTKGEMIEQCLREDILAPAIPLTVSCSHATQGRWTKTSGSHCGYCVPCIIRRAAIKKAGLADGSTYRVSNLKDTFKAKSARGRDIRSFKLSVERLHADPDIASALIRKSGPLLCSDEELEEYADVYKRGMTEVRDFLKGTKTIGG